MEEGVNDRNNDMNEKIISKKGRSQDDTPPFEMEKGLSDIKDENN